MEKDLEKEAPPDGESHSGTSIRSSFLETASTVGLPTESSQPDRKRNPALELLKAVADQWFLMGIGLVILISSQVQVPQTHQKIKQTVVSYVCVSIIFFLTGCNLKTSTLISNYSKWKMHLFVQLQSYLMTSSIIFGIVSICATNPDFMDPGLLLGMLICGCTPTTIASNVVMTGQAHGNQALTVVESTLGNFLGPFLTPLLFSMFTKSGAWYTKVLPDDRGGYGEIYQRVFKQLGLSLFIPMVSPQ
jgi:solute carrier family 10 (sodium/bile acid cotransporter), member 7